MINTDVLKHYYLTKENIDYYTGFIHTIIGNKENTRNYKDDNKVKHQELNNTVIFERKTQNCKDVNEGMDNDKNTDTYTELYLHKIHQDNYFKHSLFWIFYILHKGYDEYENINKKKLFSIETELRYLLIEELKNSMDDVKIICKTHRIKFVDVIQNLGNDGDLELPTFKILIAFKNINVIFQYKCFIEIMRNNDYDDFYSVEVYKKTHLHFKTQITTNFYSYDLIQYSNSNSREIIENSENSETIKKFINVSNILKPLKSLSSYKVKDLQDIARLLDIKTEYETETKTKILEKEIYEDSKSSDKIKDHKKELQKPLYKCTKKLKHKTKTALYQDITELL